MTDVIGDLDTIINGKRADTALIVVTDGITWHERKSDLNKIVDRQNSGKILRIYTKKMEDRMLKDLKQLRTEAGI